MSMTSQWSALYFVALMTFGNYVLFNLLVAILVEGFSVDGDVSTTFAQQACGSRDLRLGREMSQDSVLTSATLC